VLAFAATSVGYREAIHDVKYNFFKYMYSGSCNIYAACKKQLTQTEPRR